MTDAIEIRFVGELSKVALKPDDLLVLKIDRTLSRAQLEQIRDYMEQSFPGYQCVVLDREVELEVMSPQEAALLQ